MLNHVVQKFDTATRVVPVHVNANSVIMRDCAPLHVQTEFIAVDAVTVAQRHGHTVHIDKGIVSVDTIIAALADQPSRHVNRACGINAVLVADKIKPVDLNRFGILACNRPDAIAGALLHGHIGERVGAEPGVGILETDAVHGIFHHAVLQCHIAIHDPDALPVARSLR